MRKNYTSYYTGKEYLLDPDILATMTEIEQRMEPTMLPHFMDDLLRYMEVAYELS